MAMENRGREQAENIFVSDGFIPLELDFLVVLNPCKAH